MYQTFNDYLFNIKFNYKMLEALYKAYINGNNGEKEKAFNFDALKAKGLSTTHRYYRKISPKRFKKYRTQYDEIVQSLYETGAFTELEYKVEKWYMDYCKTYKRNYHKLPFNCSDYSDNEK